jgi:colanic acid biosynthesis glycosyl transferase WcaI
MRIVVLCPHFAPDVAPTGQVITRLVEELAARGHRLEVVTSLPWYRGHAVEAEWRGRPVRSEATPWGRIVRIHPFTFSDKRNLAARAAAFAAFTALATVAGAAGGPVDAVLAMSPPLTLGPAGWVTSLARRAPLVLNVQDVHPDVAVEVGALTNPAVIAALRALERFSYRHSAAVTVLSEDLAANIEAKITGRRRPEVVVIPNFVDTTEIRPADRANGYRAQYGIGPETVVMYAGNVGYSQPLDLLVDAARRLAHRPDIRFVVNGGGSALEALQARAAGLPNITFVPLQPADRLAEVLAAGDIHVVALRSGVAHSSVPSKAYSILAAGRPLVASVDPGTAIDAMVSTAGAGLAVPPEDADAFTEAVLALAADPGRRAAMGEAGRSYVEAAMSAGAVAAAYEHLLERLRRA